MRVIWDSSLTATMPKLARFLGIKRPPVAPRNSSTDTKANLCTFRARMRARHDPKPSSSIYASAKAKMAFTFLWDWVMWGTGERPLGLGIGKCQFAIPQASISYLEQRVVIMYRFGPLSPLIVVDLHQIRPPLLYACHYFAPFPFSPLAAARCANAYSTTRCISCTGAGFADHISNCLAPCCTNIS